MKVAIIGSRDFGWDFQGNKPSVDNDYYVGQPYVRRDKIELIGGCVTLLQTEDYVVSGGATGADFWAEYWARAYRKGRIIHSADWQQYGTAAGMIRNKLIIADADVVLAFFTDKSKSRGTVGSIGLAHKKGIPVYEFNGLTEYTPEWYDTWYDETRGLSRI